MEILFTYLDKGGVIFLFLFLLSILTISIILYKFFEIFLIRSLNFSKLSNFLHDIKFETTLNEIKSEHIELVSEPKQQFLKNIISIFISKKTSNEIENEINYLVEVELKKIQSLLPTLEVISQVSPLIGLLGTVIGMIDSFNELELGGSLVDPSILAGGIWTALLTTAMGLIVAIPALVSHYFLEKKIQSYVESFDLILMKLSTIK